MPTVVSVFGVEPGRIGGTETFARELSVQLGQRGWKSVLCFEVEPPKEVAEFLALPNVTLEILRNPGELNWSTTKQLAAILRRHKPEILHLHFVGFVGVVPWLASLLSVKKIFFTDHSSRPANYTPVRAPFWKRQLVRLINYPITKVTCVSKFGCQCMKSLDLLPTKRYELVYNGVDLSRVSSESARGIDFKRRFAIPEGKKIVIQISWIIPEKGVADFLELARLVKSRSQNVHFVVVGEGPYREQYTKQAEEMGISDVISWTGLVKDPFSEGVFEAADVICQLSRWEELFGWMIAEGMAFGKPVIATRVGGIPELVEEGKTGFLVPRGDTEVMAQQLLALLEDPDLHRRLGDAGRARISDNFDLRKNVASLVQSYGI